MGLLDLFQAGGPLSLRPARIVKTQDDELFDDGHAGVDGDVWRFVDVCGEYFGGGGCDGDGFNERLFGDA